MKTKKIKNKSNEKKECDKCHFLYDENDLDLYKGRWFCRNCEEEVNELEGLR